jgi:tellurite resistance protein TerC
LLKYGLAVILTFVGFKMLTEHFFTIGIGVSLVVILGVLTASIVASLKWPKHEA